MNTNTTCIRLVVGADNQNHRILTGLITEAQALLDAGALYAYEADLLAETYDWLNDNLPVPPFSTSNWSRDAVCWFKDSANDFIQKMRTLAAMLNDHGIQTRTLTPRNPGKILYEDDYQVVVLEWKKL